MSDYWTLLRDEWTVKRIAGCTCAYCFGTDICTIQQCWNTFYGKKATGASSAQFAQASANATTDPVVCKPMFCVTCNEKNDYAEPNRADGTYMCFGCRK